MSGRRKIFSAGFAAVVAVYLLVAAFFAWGFSTPALDRVWTLHHLLKIGEVGALDADDERLLEEAMLRHERLTTALLGGEDIGVVSAHLDGWIASPEATVLRSAESKRFGLMRFDVQTPRDLMPFTISVRGRGWEELLEVSEHGPVDVTLPALSGRPEIITVELEGEHFEADPSVIGVRVEFGGAP